MTDAAIAAILFVIYAVNDQWAFRCQRVGRGILLLARDSAAAHPDLFASIMPSRYVASVWLGRLIGVGAAVFAWRAWPWYGVLPVIVYAFVLGAWVDVISPWPSYRKLLGLIRDRVHTGAGGVEAMLLLPAIQHIQQQLEAGVHFEKATTGVWLSRAADIAADVARSHARDVAVKNDEAPGQDMDDCTLARGLAVIVNDALSRYIETHNDIFKVSTKRLVPIPGVFEAIDFKAHVETLTDVVDTLTRAGVTIASALEGSTDPKVRLFLGHLQEYGAALLEAVRQFRQISDKLYRKSQDPATYKWSTYQKDLDTYEDAIKHYTELGAELNAAYERIR